MRRPSFFGDFFTACVRWLHGIVQDNVISRIALAIQRSLRAGIPHEPIQPSAHLNPSINRLVIRIALFTVPLSNLN